MAKWPDSDSEFEPEFEPAFTPKPAFALDTEGDFAPLELKKPLARGKASDLQFRFCQRGRSGRRLMFNTQTESAGGSLAGWERTGESRIVANMEVGEILILIAKPIQGRSYDFSGICGWMRDIVEELRRDFHESRSQDQRRFADALRRIRFGQPYRYRSRRNDPPRSR